MNIDKTNSKISNSQAGFTMIEMLTSLSIIVILVGVFLANYHYGNVQGNLNTAAQKLASDINLVRSYALGLKVAPDGTVPPGGWGIYFHGNDNFYTIFFDKDANFYYDTDGSEKYETIDISQQNVQIEKKFYCDSTQRAHAYLVFIPPEPKIHISGSAGANPGPPNSPTTDCDTLTISLSVVGSTYTRNVVVNKYGMVDIE